MKKSFIIAILLGGLTFSSCNDFLDEPLKGEHTSKTIFNTEEDANLALTGMYNSLNFTSSSNMIWVFGDVASDDAVKGGSPADQANIGLIDNFDLRSDNGILYTYWIFAYEGISRANNIITGVYDSGISDAVKSQMMAEAKFIRAYYYFNLTNIWGKVPLRLEPIASTNVNLGLSEVSAIYTQIENDLIEASNDLPVTYTESADKGRVTKGAALGLLAKAQLYQQKWSDCIATITNQIEPLNIYDLESDYANLFKLGAENSKEAVFAVRHLSNQDPGVGNSLNQWFAPHTEGGYYFNAPTSDYVLCFSEHTTTGAVDPRLDVTVGRPGQVWTNDSIFAADWSVTEYLVRKHNQPTSEVPSGKKGDGGLPYIYMRYADILLMKSEAYMEMNELSNSALALRKVRDRVGLTDVTPVTQEQMRSAIYLERRRELGFEFHRFFDLMRWGKDVANEALGANFKWQSPRFYFPLPQAEVDRNKEI